MFHLKFSLIWGLIIRILAYDVKRILYEIVYSGHTP